MPHYTDLLLRHRQEQIMSLVRKSFAKRFFCPLILFAG